MLPRKTATLILAAVVLLAAILLFAAISAERNPGATLLTPRSQAGTQNGVLPSPAYAAKGEVVPGLPQYLILKDDPVINASYSLEYNGMAKEYTAQWNTSSSPDSVASQYKTFLTTTGWRLIPISERQSWLRGVHGVTSTADVVVGVTALGKGSQVTLTYIEK